MQTVFTTCRLSKLSIFIFIRTISKYLDFVSICRDYLQERSIYANMHFIYGFCSENARVAVRDYQGRFPNGRVSCCKVFTRCHAQLQRTGSFTLLSKENRFNVNMQQRNRFSRILNFYNIMSLKLMTADSRHSFDKTTYKYHYI